MKKYLFQRALSITLAALMVFSSVDMQVYATEPSTSEEELIAPRFEEEEIIEEENEIALLSLGADDGYSYDDSTNTLTLTDYSGTGASTEGDVSVLLYFDTDVNIVLIGDSYLSADADYGIYCDGNLSISGSGSLSISGSKTSIYAAGDISIDNCSLDLNDSENSIVANGGDISFKSGAVTADNGIYVKNQGCIKIDGGTISAKEINSEDKITILGGNVDSKLDCWDGTIEIEDGNITASSASGNGIDAEYLVMNGGTVNATGGTAYSSGILVRTNAEINGGDITVYGRQGLDIHTLTINGGKIDASGSRYGIYMSADNLTLIDGEVIVSGGTDSEDKTGILFDGGSLIVEGGTLTVNADENAIEWEGSAKSINVSGGTVELNGGAYGVYTYDDTQCGSLSVTGGEFTAEGNTQAMVGLATIYTDGQMFVGSNESTAKLASSYGGEKYIKAVTEDLVDNNCGTCGVSAEWNYENGTLTISGIGAIDNYNAEDNRPWNEFVEDIENIVVSSGITGIGDFAFADMQNLSNLSLPTSITDIGSNIIDGDILLENIVIQKNLTSISDTALTGASGLKKVVNYSTVAVKLPKPAVGHWINSSSGYRWVWGISQITQATATVVNEYEVYYDGNGCSSDPSYVDEYVTVGEQYTIAACTFAKLGFIFDGWNTKRDGTGISYTVGDSYVDLAEDGETLHLYAQWKEGTPVTIASGTCGSSLTWTLNTSGTLAISGSGAMDSYSSYSSAPWSSYRYDIKKITIGSGVTSIGSNAFYRCSYAKGSLNLSGVTSIGSDAFYACSGFDGSLSIPKVKTIGSEAFYGCSGFTGTLAIPSSLTSLGQNAFAKCSGFTRLTIANGISTIGQGAFAACTGFTGGLTIPSSVQNILPYAFEYDSGFDGTLTFLGSPNIYDAAFEDCGFTGDLNLSNVTSIYPRAFNGCSGFNGKLTLNTKLYTLGEKAFYGCSGLTGTAEIGFRYTGTVPKNCFYGCSGLTGIAIHDTVTGIDDYAFYDCSGIHGSPSLGSNVRTIGKYAFANCTGMTGSLNITSPITSVGDHAFENCTGFNGTLTINDGASLGEYAFYNCSGLTGYVALPGTLFSVPSYCFYGCSNLSGVSMPTTISTIGESAFENSGIYSSGLGKNVSTIYPKAYAGCSRMTSITLGSKVTTIHNNAFENCSSVTKVPTFPSECSIGQYAFSGCKNMSGTLVLPESMTTVPEGAFKNCQRLGGVLNLPDNLSDIASDAFYGCTGLMEVNFPAKVQTISGNPFTKDGSTNLEIIVDVVSGSYASTWAKQYGFTAYIIPVIGVTTDESLLNQTYTGENIDVSKLFMIDEDCGSATYSLGSGGTGTGTISSEGLLEISSVGTFVIEVNTAPKGDCSAGHQKATITVVMGDPYTVTFDSLGGTSVISKTANPGEKIEKPSNPSRKGYTFSGWYTSSTVMDATTMWDFTNNKVKSNMTLYAGWKAGTYRVSFSANTGNVDTDSINVTYGEMYGDLPIPTKVGYDFTGWWTSVSGGEERKADTVVYTAANHTLYAHWKAKELVVSFEPQGGIVDPTDKVVVYDSEYGTMPDPSLEGYDFVGWFTEAENGIEITANDTVKITEPRTLYAHWTLTKYLITFDPVGGSVDIDSITATYDETPYGALPVPLFPGHVFKGWYTAKEGGDLVTSETVLPTAENQILYAHWDYETYAISFDTNGGVEITSTKNVTFNCRYGELPTPERTGYDFVGWTHEGIEGIITEDSIVAIDGTHTLVAVWSAKQYTVSFDTNGGKEVDSIKVTYDMEYGDLPIPQLVGGIFLGWFVDKDSSDQITSTTRVKITEDQVLYAHWSLKYSVLAPVSSIENGTAVKAGTKVNLTSATNGAKIYFTTNPDIGLAVNEENGELWKDAYSIESNITIYAIALKSGYNDSEAVSFTYTIMDESSDWGEITEKDRLDQNISTTSEVPKDLWVAGISDQNFTGSAITFSELHVYWYKTLLDSKKDYTVKYAKNIKAGTAIVTIKGKGNYAGTITKTFTINKLSLGDGDLNNPNLTAPDIALAFNNKVQKGTTTVTYNINGKDVKLKSGTDFTYSYDSSSNYKDSGYYYVYINGKGNYTGTAKVRQCIVNAPSFISKLRFSKISAQPATGDEVRPGVVIKDGSYTLIEGTDYDVTYRNNVNPGTAKAIVTGKGSYSGSKVVTFKITAIAISKATVTGIITKDYTGTSTSQSGYALTYAAEKGDTPQPLYEGTDYTVSYSNEIKAGKNKATIIFTGINRFSGTLKKKYTINPHELADEDVTPSTIGAVVYQKGNTKPSVTVKSGETILKEGIDYTVKYTNNAAVNDGSNAKKIPTLTITGKGNYSGSVSRQFAITRSSLDNATMVASDITYANKPGICKPKITLVDSNGKKLAAGTDYDKKSIAYTYVKDVEVINIVNKQRVSVIKNGGSKVDLKNDIIPVGTEIEVTVTGIKNYEGSTKSTVFRYVAADMSKATVKIVTQYYTGRAVELSKDDISVVINKVTLDKTDYEIIGYSKNTAKGTATVTLHGLGNYGGTKKVNFKITTKSMLYTIKYNNNNSYMTSVKPFAPLATGTMKYSNIVSGTKITSNSFMRAGYTFSGWNTQPDGTGKSYTDQEEFSLKESPYSIASYGIEVTLYAQWIPVTYKITYNLGKNLVNEENPTTYTIEDEIELQTPVRTGYVFEGWYKDSGYQTVITRIPKGSIGNITLYAKMTPYMYHVSFNANGGTGTVQTLSNCAYGQTYTLPANAYKRPGYGFVGWNTAADGSGISYSDQQKVSNMSNIDGEIITLYAQWSIISYNISYVLDGGANADGNPYTYNVLTDTITLLDATKASHDFGGWYTDSKFINRVYSIPKGSTENITLYAKWIPYSYTINFDGNGATSGYMSSVTTEIGKGIVLPANLFEKTNCIFVGWNTKKDGTGTPYSDKAKVYNLGRTNGEIVTLYARWLFEGSSDATSSDTTDMINSNGAYTVRKSGMWMLSAIVYDSCGDEIDSKTNSTNPKAYIPSSIDISVPSTGEYYIKYTYCGATKESYTSPIYVDGQVAYQSYTPSGSRVTETMKLTAKQYPDNMTLSNGSTNNKTLRAVTDTSITITTNNASWIYTSVITKDGNSYSNNTWADEGEPHQSYEIGKLSKGTYEISIVEYSCGEKSEMVYIEGKLTYQGTGIYYPDLKSTKVTWKCTVIVE